ncbi:MAG: hypothetical protein A2W23_05115 [Planctomycetes bacterium RBG_16_43_13]|nr:MAG: hypothetical protein A2W23_05115 [Planctomycetes bacterium RBG_16_43_13]
MFRFTFWIAVMLCFIILVGGSAVTLSFTQSKITNWMKKARGEYIVKLQATKQDDADSLYELGAWARKNGLDGAAQAQFRKTLKIKPDHEKARAAAGYVKKGNTWVRDYTPLAKKIRFKIDDSISASAGEIKTLLSNPKNLADMLKQIDDRLGLYRGAEDFDIEIHLKGQASGVGVTWPVSAMGDDKVPPPFVATIELDGSVLAGKGMDYFRKALTHELTHALMGAVQIFMYDWQAEGIASYTGGDDTSAYVKFKAKWDAIAKKYGAGKVKEWGMVLTDEWVDLWEKGDLASAAFEKTIGKTTAEIEKEVGR